MNRLVLMAALVLVLLRVGFCATPQSTAFTYQGDLRENNQPANGNFDLVFKLFDAESGGNQIGSTVTKTAVAVNNGKFTADLDFLAGIFTGNQLWIEVTVGTETLAPRQPVNAVPVAQYALTAPPPPSPVFMSSTASATLTTDASGNTGQVAVLPLSGYTSTAYASPLVAGLGWVYLNPSGSNTPFMPQLLATNGMIGTVRARLVLEQAYSGPPGTVTVQVFTALLGSGTVIAPAPALCSAPVTAPQVVAPTIACVQSRLALPYTAGTGAAIVVSLTSTAATSLQAQVAVSVGP